MTIARPIVTDIDAISSNDVPTMHTLNDYAIYILCLKK